MQFKAHIQTTPSSTSCGYNRWRLGYQHVHQVCFKRMTQTRSTASKPHSPVSVSLLLPLIRFSVCFPILLFDFLFPFRSSCSFRDRQHILDPTISNSQRDAIDTHHHSVERESVLEVRTSCAIYNFTGSCIFLFMPLSYPGSRQGKVASQEAKSCLHSGWEGAAS